MIVFLVEEESMYTALSGLLPKLFPAWQEGAQWQCLVHEGKSDLEISIPRKLKGYRAPGTRFVVLRDNDSADCDSVKQRLRQLCEAANRPDTLIRLACQQLEAWFLGDLAAVSKAYGKPAIAAQQDKRKYRDPDRLSNAPDEIRRLTGVSGKIDRARRIAEEMNLSANRSRSFRVFVDGLRNWNEVQE